MKPQLFTLDLVLLCISCGASALAVTIPVVSTSPPAANITSLGAALDFGTDAVTFSKTRRKRYISQNDMLAILDYHNKVRGKVFPPASNMEYMVGDRFWFKNIYTYIYCTILLQPCVPWTGYFTSNMHQSNIRAMKVMLAHFNSRTTLFRKRF